MSSKLLTLCVVLAIGPPLAVFAYHQKRLESERPAIEPGLVDGSLLYFTAKWCGACRHVKPAVAELYREGFDVRTIDIDSHRDKAARYKIRGIPTFVLVRNGEEVRRHTGVASPEKLREMWR